MDKMKTQLRLSYKVEILGTGFYKSLGKQYGKKQPELAKKLNEFADHEYLHGVLFRQSYINLYGKNPGSEKLWLGIGKAMAFTFLPFSLKFKLKKLSLIEHIAVKQIERDLLKGEENPYLEIAKKILPDEKEHAKLYKEWCAS